VSVPPPHLYRQQALALGRDERAVERVIEVQARLRDRGVYPVLTLGHLAHLTGASHRYLREIVERRRDPYFDIDRPKRDGRTRPISSPEPVLMDVQRWILRSILPANSVHPASYAYQPDRSSVECARFHTGARWLIKLDLHDFFGAISERRVYTVFRSLGYERLLSFELSRLCTRLKRWPAARIGDDQPQRRHNMPYAVLPDGCLPQGAPTSGALANAVAIGIDRKLSRLAQSTGLLYTRYSDDVTFSGSSDFSRRHAFRIVREASALVESERFRLHRAKTRIIPPGARAIVLGLHIDSDCVRLLPGFKRRIEVHVRGVSKFGIGAHAAHRGFQSIFSMIDHVDGCIAFATSVEPTFGRQIRQAWDIALSTHGYPGPSLVTS
jgi:RNA-directed DNA polymerase